MELRLITTGNNEPTLWTNPSYEYDMVDVTRQVMANAFIPYYPEQVSTYKYNSSSSAITAAGNKLVHLLEDLDKVLLTNPSFRLSGWIDAARAWAHGDAAYSAYLEYNARSQVTLWDHRYPNSTPSAEYNDAEFDAQMLDLGLKRCEQTWNAPAPTREQTNLKKVLAYVKNQWPGVFGA